jgi:hypothetical protein
MRGKSEEKIYGCQIRAKYLRDGQKVALSVLWATGYKVELCRVMLRS